MGMPDCRYCGAELSDEDAHDEHLLAEHEDELGPIDRRRVTTGDRPLGERIPVALLAVIGTAIVVVGFILLAGGGADEAADEPSAVGSVHEHGILVIVIDGEQVDFSRPAYQYPNAGSDAFHFEAGSGRVFHVHARDVTLAYAMDTLGIGVTATSVTYQGTTYRGSDSGTTVEVTVNGRAVDPSSYVLHGPTDASRAAEGDRVRIVVERR